MRTRGDRRFGAILWESDRDVDDAIRAVKAFPDPNDAIRYVAPLCARGERWAVVDLTTMQVVAEGAAEAAAEPSVPPVVQSPALAAGAVG